MLRFFRSIRKKMIEYHPKDQTGNIFRRHILYADDQILLVLRIFCPVSDKMSVETMDNLKTRRAVRYVICRFIDVATVYIAYLRHAILCLYSVFYQYAVPTRQKPSVKSQNPSKSVIQSTDGAA